MGKKRAREVRIDPHEITIRAKSAEHLRLRTASTRSSISDYLLHKSQAKACTRTRVVGGCTRVLGHVVRLGWHEACWYFTEDGLVLLGAATAT